MTVDNNTKKSLRRAYYQAAGLFSRLALFGFASAVTNNCYIKGCHLWPLLKVSFMFKTLKGLKSTDGIFRAQGTVSDLTIYGKQARNTCLLAMKKSHFPFRIRNIKIGTFVTHIVNPYLAFIYAI
jgi:hypothetical protein